MAKTVLMQGNEACVEGAIAAGMRFYAGYPITPSTEISELFEAARAEGAVNVWGKYEHELFMRRRCYLKSI